MRCLRAIGRLSGQVPTSPVKDPNQGKKKKKTKVSLEHILGDLNPRRPLAQRDVDILVVLGDQQTRSWIDYEPC
jgi:hypothetical protein